MALFGSEQGDGGVFGGDAEPDGMDQVEAPSGPSMFGSEPAAPAPTKNLMDQQGRGEASGGKALPNKAVEPETAGGSYKVIALKYRPQTFDDLVGQSHIKEALTNAIRQNKVAHAFLFSGSRGTGKTTSARIFAKALNCLAGSTPTPDPCGQCVACREIAESRDLDVLEIDGASNNGIEQIRELRGSIDNKPARDRYKVVIIDEVHMLSTAAFNALLKTLEEPPNHVKFIFATTDPHKVPETIHSRCQHYDFRRLSAAEIAGCLRDIADREGVTTDGGVFESIAAICEGGMRDAQSKLDQLIAFRGNHLSVTDLEQVFGLVSREGLLRLIQAARRRDVAAVFRFVEDAFSQGKDLGALVASLTRLYRDLMIIRACGHDFSGLDLLPSEKALLPDEARQWEQDALMLAVDLLSACGARLKTAEFPRFVLESSLLKLCDLGALRPIGDLVSAVDTILRSGGGGQTPAVPARNPTPPPPPHRAPEPVRPSQPPAPTRPTAPTQAARRAPDPDETGESGNEETGDEDLSRFTPPPPSARREPDAEAARKAKPRPPVVENAISLVREVFKPEK